MSAVSRSSSSRPCGILRCVERCWPSAAQARRSETRSSRRTCSIQARRRAGLSNFPGLPPGGSACPASGPRSLCEDENSRSPDPSDASPGPTSDPRTLCASGSTSPRSRQLNGSHPRSASLATSQHQPAATSQRSLQACVSSSPFAVLLDGKAILRVGPLHWGWANRVVIENQLKPSDHGHLGQLLTYAAGTQDGLTAVWIASVIRPEHA